MHESRLVFDCTTFGIKYTVSRFDWLQMRKKSIKTNLSNRQIRFCVVHTLFQNRWRYQQRTIKVRFYVMYVLIDFSPSCGQMQWARYTDHCIQDQEVTSEFNLRPLFILTTNYYRVNNRICTRGWPKKCRGCPEKNNTRVIDRPSTSIVSYHIQDLRSFRVGSKYYHFFHTDSRLFWMPISCINYVVFT